jgi:polar amino acid transport system substrate-binding protein
MKIKSTLLALLAGAALVTGACAPAEKGLLETIREAKVIRIATDPAYPPYSELNAAGEYVGFDSDVAREVAKRLGVTVEWVTPDWAAITAGNWGGRWDISIGSMTQTEDRAKVVDFLEPYFYEAGYLIVATDSSYTTVADLAGKTICAGESTTHATWIETGFATSTVVDVFNAPPAGAILKTYPTDYNCIEAYLAGRTDDWDAMAQSREFIENAIANSDGKLKFLSEEPNFAGRISFALDKSGLNTATAIVEINKIIAEMHADGTMSGFSMKHLGRDVTKP